MKALFKMPEKYVITGGPNSGKTTTLNALEKQGFKVFQEAARIILKEEIRSNREAITWKGDIEARQRKILELQLKQEKQAENINGAVFFDRGIPDGIVYYRIAGAEIPEILLSEATKKKRNYKKVFIFDMLPYKTDGVRKEPEEIAKKIHEMIYQIYSELGYEIVKVSVMPVEERVRFIRKST